MGYKIYEDCFRYNISDRKDKYMFSTDTKEKANKIINALERRIDMREIESLIRQALAIEMLEYEDKNHLSGNDKSRSETKIELLSEAMQKIKKDKVIPQSK